MRMTDRPEREGVLRRSRSARERWPRANSRDRALDVEQRELTGVAVTEGDNLVDDRGELVRVGDAGNEVADRVADGVGLPGLGPRLSAWSVRWPVKVILAMRSRWAAISNVVALAVGGQVVKSDADWQVAAAQDHGAGGQRAVVGPPQPAGDPDRA